MDYETRLGANATAVWEIWTGNGRDMDIDDRNETGKQASDAVANTYVDGITDRNWQIAALRRLGCDMSQTIFTDDGDD